MWTDGHLFKQRNQKADTSIKRRISSSDNNFEIGSINRCHQSLNGFFRLSLNCIGALSLLRSVHTFSWFLKLNWRTDFGLAEKDNGEKKLVVKGAKLFHPEVKKSEKTVFEQQFSFLIVVFFVR